MRSNYSEKLNRTCNLKNAKTASNIRLYLTLEKLKTKKIEKSKF